jgi:hypothetical protein
MNLQERSVLRMQRDYESNLLIDSTAVSELKQFPTHLGVKGSSRDTR